MEWSKITLRKERVTKENRRKVSNETGIHTRKLKLALQSSMKETQMFEGREASERSSCRNESSTRNFGTGDNLQRGSRDNLCPEAVCILIPDPELHNVNAEGENEETANNNMMSIIAEAVTFSENSIGEFDNSRNDTESNNGACQAGTNTGHIYSNSILNPATTIKVLKTDETPKSPVKGVSIENINNGVEENLTEIKRKIKFNDHRPRFANMPPNEENLLKYGSEINISSGSDIFKSFGFSTDAKTTNDYDNSVKTKIRIKRYQHESVPLAKEEIIQNNFKSYSHLPNSKKETKRNSIDEAFVSKSVTDLISYFESLNSSLNKSSVKLPNQKKSKIKSSELKKDLKDDNSIKLNRDLKPNDNSSLSAEEVLKNEINPRKCPTEINKEVVQPDVYSTPRQQTAEETAEFRIRSSHRKGKRLHFEENKTHSENGAKKIKEHRFIFHDGVPNETEYLKTSNPRRYRSRFTRKNIKHQPLSEFHDARNHEYKPLNCRMTEGGIFFTNDDSNEKNIISNVSDENSMPWKQNSNNKRAYEANNSFHKKKPKAFEDGPNMKGFFGILLTMIVLGIIHKVISEYL